MLRIIAGRFGSRKLTAPQGRDTRPTTDRVKEAVFSILLPYLPEARVLDLFCGSGALALEALSRGAARAILVDRDAKAIAAARANIHALGVEDECVLLQREWGQALTLLHTQGYQFDIVFLDPPYAKGLYTPAIEALYEENLLAPDALIVAEHDAEYTLLLNDAFELTDKRRYGDTAVSLIKRKVTP